MAPAERSALQRLLDAVSGLSAHDVHASPRVRAVWRAWGDLVLRRADAPTSREHALARGMEGLDAGLVGWLAGAVAEGRSLEDLSGELTSALAFIERGNK